MKNSGTALWRLGVRKTLRDMRQGVMQFIAVFLLCFIGVFSFSGLYGMSDSLSLTFDQYARENRLADMWVHCAAGFTDSDLTELKYMPGVGGMQARTSVSAECPDLPGTVAKLEIYENVPVMNMPYLIRGALLQDNDHGACLIDRDFAERIMLDVGDKIAVRINGQRVPLRIRGIVKLPEHPARAGASSAAGSVNVSGYVVVNSPALSEMRPNTVLIRLDEGADSEKLISEINTRMPYASVILQNNMAGIDSVRSQTSIYRKVAWIIPALSCAVVVMVVVSTLRRLILGQRTQIGIMKSLGLTGLHIQCHYLAYALFPSAFGCAAGLLAGTTFLQKKLWNVVEANIPLPYKLVAPVSPVVIVMAVLPVIFSIGVCLLTLIKTNRTWAAALLSPPVPESGRRVFPECWPRVWSRLSFRFRMVLRGIGRNRARSLMQIFGVFFCNMLLITSLGAPDSIVYFTDRHYSGTLKYDYRLEPDMEQALPVSGYRGRLPAEEVEGVMERVVTLTYGTMSEGVSLNVLEDNQRLIDLGFVDGRKVTLPDTGLIATKKLADRFGFKKGDTVSLNMEGTRDPLFVRVEDIVTIYRSQGLYIGETAWRACHRGAFLPNKILLRGSDRSDLEYIVQKERFENLESKRDSYENALFILKPLNIMFMMLALISLGLCFAVCYNLGLISFAERRREYATARQLGYRVREIRSVMLSETAILSGFAVLLSIVPAYWLTVLSVKLTENKHMLHATNIEPGSYIAACLITFAFSMGIQLILSIKAARVPMAEALKTRE